jgi:hypothetical protein
MRVSAAAAITVAATLLAFAPLGVIPSYNLSLLKSRMDEFLCQKRSSKQNTPLSLD